MFSARIVFPALSSLVRSAWGQSSPTSGPHYIQSLDRGGPGFDTVKTGARLGVKEGKSDPGVCGIQKGPEPRAETKEHILGLNMRQEVRKMGKHWE